MSNNKPAHSIQIGKTKAAIWKNESEDRTFYSVTFSRTYELEGELKNADSFSGLELLAVSKLADLAHSWILNHK